MRLTPLAFQTPAWATSKVKVKVVTTHALHHKLHPPYLPAKHAPITEDGVKHLRVPYTARRKWLPSSAYVGITVILPSLIKRSCRNSRSGSAFSRIEALQGETLHSAAR
jgi:hypothetical protein